MSICIDTFLFISGARLCETHTKVPRRNHKAGNVRASHTQLDKENLREAWGLIVYVFFGGQGGGVPLCMYIRIHVQIFSEVFLACKI